jgi:hypothetical protein
MTTNRAGRPASIRTRKFCRYLTPEDAAILAAAGAGDISAGFRNLLSLYQELYEQGIKSTDEALIVFNNHRK